MTALEKLRESHPDADLENASFWTCPYDFGLEPVGEDHLAACAAGKEGEP